MPDKPATANPAMTPQLQTSSQWRRVAELQAQRVKTGGKLSHRAKGLFENSSETPREGTRPTGNRSIRPLL